MRSRSCVKLRDCDPESSVVNRSRSESKIRKKPKKESEDYERERKKAWRRKTGLSTKDGLGKRGPKEKVGLKTMTKEERREYERIQKKEQRLRKKDELKKATTSKSVDEEDMESSNDEDIDFGCRTTAAAIMNIVQNSPQKKLAYVRGAVQKIEGYFQKYKLDENEILDVFVVLAQVLSSEVVDLLREKGVEIRSIPKSLKRHRFSELPKTSLHNHKDRLHKIFSEYTDVGFCDTFFTVIKTRILSADCLTNLNSCGISISCSSFSGTAKLNQVLNVSGGVTEIGNTTPNSKLVKVSAMAKTIKQSELSVSDKGCVKSLSKTFAVSEKFAKKVVKSVDKSPAEIIKRKKIETIHDTEWPAIINEFCFTKPICREAPGETVSIAYGVRADKYIRQFSIREIFNFFTIKYPDFSYHITTFRALVPKNLVAATLRDVKRNTCPLHENVKRSVKAINRFFRKHAPELIVPTSTLDISLQLICNPFPENEQMNRDPLNWHYNCTKGSCQCCSPDQWFEYLSTKIKEKKILVEIDNENRISGLDEMDITYSHWVREKNKNKGNTQVILRKESDNILNFINEVLMQALVKDQFPEHLRKSWMQWQITKFPLAVPTNNPLDVVIRTREDFQEDLKFLCTSETVSTHRGVGVITMMCYPVVLEVFKTDGSVDLYGLIYMSNSKCKSFETVRYFEGLVVDFVRGFGLNILRYDRLSDGCTYQFWCWGAYQMLENMPNELGIPVCNMHRYERYEGKNFSDALGSILKRKMRASALQNKVQGNDENGIREILEEVSHDCDLDDVVFESQESAFQWLKMCMSKGDDSTFSKKFKAINLFWVPDEDIPKKVLIEKESRKIPKIKSYNTLAAFRNDVGVYVRDSTCSNCEFCLRGYMLHCTSNRNGEWKKYIISKKLPPVDTRVRYGVNEEGEDEEDEDDEEEFLCPESDTDDDDVDDVEVEDTTGGHYVLYTYAPNKYYVACVIENTTDKVVLRCARKYASGSSDSITFIWPDVDDIAIVDSLSALEFKRLPYPKIGRRGTSMVFKKKAFGKIVLTKIY